MGWPNKARHYTVEEEQGNAFAVHFIVKALLQVKPVNLLITSHEQRLISRLTGLSSKSPGFWIEHQLVANQVTYFHSLYLVL